MTWHGGKAPGPTPAMSALLDVILPVFLVIGFGYAAVRRGLPVRTRGRRLMRFAQNFAVPCLLFRSIAQAGSVRRLSTLA
jgi:predicted permease